MTYPRTRLTVAAALFAVWLSYLLWLVLLTRHTIVLSRPQFLVSDLCVLAKVTGEQGKPDGKVEILDLFWYKNPADLKLKDQTITVANLHEAGPQGYAGPGQYILPLQKQEAAGVTMYFITMIPLSPGYDWRTAAFVTVYLSHVGADHKRLAQLAHEHLELDLETAQARVKAIAEGPTMILARGVPRERAIAFVHALNELDGKSAPHVQLMPYDIRIYPWTPETEKQIKEMAAAR